VLNEKHHIHKKNRAPDLTCYTKRKQGLTQTENPTRASYSRLKEADTTATFLNDTTLQKPSRTDTK